MSDNRHSVKLNLNRGNTSTCRETRVTGVSDSSTLVAKVCRVQWKGSGRTPTFNLDDKLGIG